MELYTLCPALPMGQVPPPSMNLIQGVEGEEEEKSECEYEYKIECGFCIFFFRWPLVADIVLYTKFAVVGALYTSKIPLHPLSDRREKGSRHWLTLE